jgi:hypothetical protein
MARSVGFWIAWYLPLVVLLALRRRRAAGRGDPVPAERHGPVHLALPALWATVAALLGLGLALEALFPHRLPAGLRRVDRAWAPAVAVLRGLHSGYIADSVTWLVVGAAAFGTLLALVLR